MQKRYIPATVFSLILCVFLSGCGARNISGRLSTAATEETIAPEGVHSSKEQSSSTAATQEIQSDQTFVTGKKGDIWILPDAQTHIYTEQELSGLTREELRLARNEIYAKRGRKFKAIDLAAYFLQKEWYLPSVEADDFDEGILNPEEIGNLKIIKQIEDSYGQDVITCPKIGTDQFPALDGSTATIPISIAIYRLSTGASLREAEAFANHGKTTNAYLNLIEDRGPKLVIAYAPGDRVKESLEEHGDNLIIKPIGRDALVFMKNEGNPVNSLTQKQVRGIYTGLLTNWEELGGKDQEIRAFQRPENSGSQNLMGQLAMKGTPMAKAPADYVVSEMGELLERVSAYDNSAEAIGYSVYYYARNMYQKPGLRFMAIDGIEPSGETIRDGRYPYVSDFYAAVRKDEPKDSTAYQLFEWLTSEDGQALINGLGYVGIEDTQKALPDVLTEENDSLSGEIPLTGGNVILASGQSLYGESGFGVFDKSMNLLKFHRYLLPCDMDQFMECAADGMMPAQDTITTKYGIYSLKEERFICPPEYDYAFVTKDGFALEKGIWDEKNEIKKWYVDITDQYGKIIQANVDEESIDMDALKPDSEKKTFYNAKEFAAHYPDVLKRHGIGSDDIACFYADSGDMFAVIDTEAEIFYYNMNGEFLFSLKKDPHTDYIHRQPFVINSRMYGISVYTGEPLNIHTYIYQDHKLIKTLISDGTEGQVSYIGEHFYTRYQGNYLYVYNYQDQPCAKFLGGYITDD